MYKRVQVSRLDVRRHTGGLPHMGRSVLGELNVSRNARREKRARKGDGGEIKI
jgi:hypothetical protein